MLDAHTHGAQVVLPRCQAVGHQAVGVGIAQKHRFVNVRLAAVRSLRQDGAVVGLFVQRVRVRVIAAALGSGDRRRRRCGRGGVHGRGVGQQGHHKNSEQRDDERGGAYQDGDVDGAAFLYAAEKSAPALCRPCGNIVGSVARRFLLRWPVRVQYGHSNVSIVHDCNAESHRFLSKRTVAFRGFLPVCAFLPKNVRFGPVSRPQRARASALFCWRRSSAR